MLDGMFEESKVRKWLSQRLRVRASLGKLKVLQMFNCQEWKM